MHLNWSESLAFINKSIFRFKLWRLRLFCLAIRNGKPRHICPLANCAVKNQPPTLVAFITNKELPYITTTSQVVNLTISNYRSLQCSWLQSCRPRRLLSITSQHFQKSDPQIKTNCSTFQKASLNGKRLTSHPFQLHHRTSKNQNHCSRLEMQARLTWTP